MMRIRLRKIVDPLLALVVLNQVTTGLMIALGHDSEALTNIHLAGGMLLVALLVVHVSVNWPILKATYSRKKKREQTSA